MKLNKIMMLAVACTATSLAFAQKGTTLKEGDKAPALAVAKWSKGKAVKSFEKGKVYVVEFWATWCGPCKTSIPHLTDMAKKYAGKATFTGVSVWEQKKDNSDTSYYAAVDKFVKDMGAKMDYNVAIDGPAGTMADTWMKAAGQDGIPTAFVINQEGKIAWIGHPMSGLDEVVGEVIAKKYDSKAAAAKRKAEQDAQGGMQEAAQKLQAAMESKDPKAVMSAYEEIIAKYPQAKPQVAPAIFTALLEMDSKAAVQFGKDFVASTKDMDAMTCNMIAWPVIEKEGMSMDDYKWALGIAEKAVAMTKETDYAILDTCAYGYYRTGDKAKALAMQQKAVDLCEKDPKADGDMKKDLKSRLELYSK